MHFLCELFVFAFFSRAGRRSQPPTKRLTSDDGAPPADAENGGFRPFPPGVVEECRLPSGMSRSMHMGGASLIGDGIEKVPDLLFDLVKVTIVHSWVPTMMGVDGFLRM